MEEKKSVFDYLGEILTVFGFTMLAMNIFCAVFGSSAKEFSTMFALGNEGLPVTIAFQFFCISVLIVGIRFVFFSDTLLKNMPIWLRTLCMLVSVIVLITVFVIAFGWFPVMMWQPWVMFIICFSISFLGSYAVMLIKERVENKRMAEALQRLKEKEEKTK